MKKFTESLTVIPPNQQSSREYNATEDVYQETRFHKRRFTAIKLLMWKTHQNIHMCKYVFHSRQTLFFILSFTWVSREGGHFSATKFQYNKGWILNLRASEEEKFKEPKAVHLYSNRLPFCLHWSPAPIFDTQAGSSCHSCAAQWIARACSLSLWLLIIKEGLSLPCP